MWMLVQTTPPEGSPPLQYWLCTGMKYLVGRKEGECDILVDNDKSISRGHADVKVLDVYDLKDRSSRPEVYVMDKSTYGTKLNGGAVSKKEGELVEEGDEVTFGVFNSVFKLMWWDVVVCLSKTSTETKAILRKDLTTIGAHITTSLTFASHVITDIIQPSSVTIGALALGIPMVTREWVSSLANRNTTRTPPPPAVTFTPPPAEIWVKSHQNVTERTFECNPLRQQLFKDIVFVFLDSSSYLSNKEVITYCKGLSVDGSNIDFSNQKSRSAFFIRYQDGIVIDDKTMRSVAAETCRKMGFTVFDQTAILGSLLAATPDCFRRVKPPPQNLLDTQNLSRSNTSATTQLGLLDRSLTKGDIIGSLSLAPQSVEAEIVIPENTPSLPTPKGVDVDVVDLDAAEASNVLEIDTNDEGGRKQSIVSLSPDADAGASPEQEQGLKRKSSSVVNFNEMLDLSQAELDDDMDLLRHFTDPSKAKKKKKQKVSETNHELLEPKEEPASSVANHPLPCKDEPVKLSSVILNENDNVKKEKYSDVVDGVAVAMMGLVRKERLDKRWPCYADWGKDGKGAYNFVKQKHPGYNETIHLKPFEEKIQGQLHLSQADHEVQYEDLIELQADHPGRRQKTRTVAKQKHNRKNGNSNVNLLPVATKINNLKNKPKNAPLVRGIIDPFDFPSDED